MRKLMTICILGVMILGISQIAGAGVVRSWDDDNQRGTD